MYQIDTSLLRKISPRHVDGGTDARRRVIDAAGLGFGQRHEFFEVLRTQGWIDDDHRWCIGNQGHALEVRLNTEIKEVFKDPEIVKKLRSQGLLPATGSPAQFSERIESETLKWA